MLCEHKHSAPEDLGLFKALKIDLVAKAKLLTFHKKILFLIDDLVHNRILKIFWPLNKFAISTSKSSSSSCKFSSLPGHSRAEGGCPKKADGSGKERRTITGSSLICILVVVPCGLLQERLKECTQPSTETIETHEKYFDLVSDTNDLLAT